MAGKKSTDMPRRRSLWDEDSEHPLTVSGARRAEEARLAAAGEEAASQEEPIAKGTLVGAPSVAPPSATTSAPGSSAGSPTRAPIQAPPPSTGLSTAKAGAPGAASPGTASAGTVPPAPASRVSSEPAAAQAPTATGQEPPRERDIGLPGSAAARRRRAAATVSSDGSVVKARNPFVWVRRGLLLLGLVVVVGLGVLLAAYRFGQAGTEPTAVVSDPALEGVSGSPERGDEVLAGQGFDYTQTSDGQPVFRIRAERSRQQRDDTAHLEVVTLDIFRADGSEVNVTSDRATFNETAHQARLEGNVVLDWDDLELQARALELRQQGQVLASNGPVELRYPPNFEGRASILRIDRNTDSITLAGGVHIRTEEGAEKPLRLDGERVVYQRSIGLLRAVGEASLDFDGQSIAAHFLTVFLEEDLETVDSIRARWNVEGGRRIVREDGGVDRMRYRGQFLELKDDPEAPEAAEVKSFLLDGEDEPVVLEITDATGLRRTLTASKLEGRLRQQRLARLDGFGAPLVLRETLETAGEPYLLRQGCATRATAFFLQDGDLDKVYFANQVELSDPRVHLSGGQQAELDLRTGRMEIEGTEVALLSDRLEVTAPRLTYGTAEEGNTELVRAGGGRVHARLDEGGLGALADTPLGQGSGPIRVDAEEALWTLDPPTFSFRGAVRAWRDQNLILADQLRGDELKHQLAASGDVKTVWHPPSGSQGGGALGDSSQPIEVTSQRMTYQPNENLLAYEEDVAMRQGERTLTCQNLGVELADGGNAERMVCREEVHLTDPEGSREVAGDRAVYTPGARRVEIFGEEVVLLDGATNRMVGRYLTYDLSAGTVSLRSRAPESETTEETEPKDVR